MEVDLKENRGMINKKVAILDLGTNTFHLMVAEIDDSTFRVLLRKKVAVKLGQGSINQGFINREAQERAMSAIHEIMELIHTNKVDEIRAIATSAIRNATNTPIR